MLKLCLIMTFFFLPFKANANMALNEDEINLYCLSKFYPQITGIENAGEKGKWLVLKNGSKIPYQLPQYGNGLDADVKSSMDQIYPLEPHRPDTPIDFAPGRKRSYDLLRALYGATRKEVQTRLVAVNFLGKRLFLSPPAALALQKSIKNLENLASQDDRLKKLLKPEGGYFWRNIAGEKVQSAHSYGIAIDLGVNDAPYWRWNRQRPHPLQKTWPSEIVSALEEQGFIWGGKWHEYDLMHYEYRPELVCKSKLQKPQ